ncbi:MAG TPA: sigma-70 family RNA polymerase sigma factor [Anaerolineales bacterium]|nr:sigma-70 family RNA polymerase sigma factor [Anaerolineales bacterium]
MTKPIPEQESEWLRQARDGDSAAFARLVEAYQVPVFNLCYRMLGGADLAEEASQEVFLKAFRNLSAYDPRRPFRTWLLSIAAHHAIDGIRRRRLTTVSLEDLPAESVPGERSLGPEAALLEREKGEEVRAMLGQLGPRDRAAVILRYWYDLSYEEMADMLQTSVGSVKSRLHRARRLLAMQATPDRLPVGGGGGRRVDAPAV